VTTLAVEANCPDCGIAPGLPHGEDCDVARCLFTGMQRLSCDGLHVDEVMPGCYVPRDCGRDIWTGQWPGEAECAEFGWYAYFAGAPAGEAGTGWVRCAPDYPEAVADLTRLVMECSWDASARRWVRKP
jgi:hypothetical protein